MDFNAYQAALADEFSVTTGSRPISAGLGILYKDKPYRGYDSSAKTNPVPVILYEGENFFVRGSSLGWSQSLGTFRRRSTSKLSRLHRMRPFPLP